MNHTPGPWQVGFPDGSGRNYITDSEGRVVVRGSSYAAAGVIKRADAKLIAAAPELLATWKMGAELDVPAFLEWVADRMEFVHGENPLFDYMHHLRAIAQAGRAAIDKATSE